MHSISNWENASSPHYGYGSNVDKQYPYSEVPFIGKYKLVKIPQNNVLLDLVDYWGEGRLESGGLLSGFSDCYNVNHPHQCVSNGMYRGRKIPNRVPVQSYTTCDTSSYIKADSVRTVTLMGAPINNSCASDIARMISKVEGKVVIFGFTRSTADVNNLENELNKFNFVHCPHYELPQQLNGLTLFDSISGSNLNAQLRSQIISGNYDQAVENCKILSLSSYSDTISNVINQLLQEANKNLMSLAYQLWNNNAQNVVIRHFPSVFKAICSEDFVTIVNKKNSLALKLAYSLDSDGDKMAWGDAKDKTSVRVIWKLIPVWKNGRVAYKLLNVDCGMFLKLAVYKDNINDREAWGAYVWGDDRYLWYLDPVMLESKLLFFVVNVQFSLGLKLAASADDIGDRQAWGHNSDVHGDAGYFGWHIRPSE